MDKLDTDPNNLPCNNYDDTVTELLYFTWGWQPQVKQASHGLWGSDGFKMPIHVHCFWQVIWPVKCLVGHTDQVFGAQSGFISSLCAQNYKSLCAAATICATVVSIQPHPQTAFGPAYMNSAASWAKNGVSKLSYNLTKQNACYSYAGKEAKYLQSHLVQPNTMYDLICKKHASWAS